ncbi:MAG: Ig-like domain-containing protein [Kofleriaceae bacterium]
MGRIVGALLCAGMVAIALLGLGNVSSCYSAPNPACGFLCNDQNGFSCPEDYSCSHTAGVCVSKAAPTGMRCYADAAPAPEGLDADSTPPTVIMTGPGNGETGVARDVQIQVYFSLPIQNYTATTVQVTDGATPVATVLQFDQATNILRIAPLTLLGGGSTITVALSGLTGGNPLHVPVAASSFSFSTIDDSPPQLILSTPLDMATGVPVGSTIVITFSEPVHYVDTTSFSVFQAATNQPGTITSADNLTWTYTPTAALPAASLVTVMLTAAITDAAGNPLVPTMFTFTTQ